MRCAVCQNSDNVVVNIIMAEPTDPAPQGCFLVGLSDDTVCEIGYIWDGSGFIAPVTQLEMPPADQTGG